MKYILETYGSSKGNPGPAAAGFAIYRDIRNPYKKQTVGEGTYIPPEKYILIVEKNARYIGFHTSNYAEYQAIIDGLKRCIELEITSLRVKTNSDLGYKQLNEFEEIVDEEISRQYIEIQELEKKFDFVLHSHVYKYRNKDAIREVKYILAGYRADGTKIRRPLKKRRIIIK